MKKLLWKLNNKKKRLIANLCAWLLSRETKGFMKQTEFRNVRRNLGKHNGLWVVAYICTEYPFNKGKLNVTCDNVINLNRTQNHCDGSEADSDRFHDSCFDKEQGNRSH